MATSRMIQAGASPAARGLVVHVLLERFRSLKLSCECNSALLFSAFCNECGFLRGKNTLAYQINSLLDSNFRNLVTDQFNCQIPHLYKEMVQRGVQKNTPHDIIPKY